MEGGRERGRSGGREREGGRRVESGRRGRTESGGERGTKHGLRHTHTHILPPKINTGGVTHTHCTYLKKQPGLESELANR